MSSTNFLVYNAKIWQVGKPDLYWMVFSRDTGYISDCGTVDNVPELDIFPNDSKRDYDGQRIFPGFHDSHIHVGYHGEYLTRANLKGCSSIKELQLGVTTHREQNPDQNWIIGYGWKDDVLGRYPNKFDLDQVCSDKPVFLHNVDMHIGVANSTALEMAGINRDTVSPVGGSVDKDENNEPTGVVREGAVGLFDAFLTPSAGEIQSQIEVAVNECVRNGITSAHACESDTWKMFCNLDDQGKLPIRIFYSAYYHKRESGCFPKAGEKHSDLLSCDRIKIFIDGSLGATTAAISLPYKGRCHHGILRQTDEQLLHSFQEATSQGYRLEVHVIGDAAADAALNAMEKCHIRPEKRPIFIHCQILRKDLIPRMKDLGVIANVQPSFVPSDASCTNFLPTELQSLLYPWKTLINSGIVCAGGSDAPVERPSPLEGIHAAIFRPSSHSEADLHTPFKAEECVTVTEAVDMYTINGAYTARREQDLGQLAPGFQADFVVVEGQEDVVEKPEIFREAQIAEVWVAGRQAL